MIAVRFGREWISAAGALMSACVNLLLLLSALLSALSGVGIGSRVPPAVAVERIAETAPTNRVCVRTATRPRATPFRLTALLAVFGSAWRIAPAAPRFLNRRRE